MDSRRNGVAGTQQHENNGLDLEVGAAIWIPCQSLVWRDGIVTALGDGVATAVGSCEIEFTNTNGKQREWVSLQPALSGKVQPYLLRNEVLRTRKGCLMSQDLSQLSRLHEAALLHALQVRFEEGVIYTQTGPVLLALNPFRNMPGLYGQDWLQYFAERDSDEKSPTPHVYAVGRAAYEGIHRKSISQTVLVSGESGAGKTETTKFVMRFLALAGAGWTQSAMSNIEQRVLESIPLLEALGNAKTLRNDNSSRFGKYTELQFGRDSGALASRSGPRLMGAKTHTYLLEKVRVVGPHEGERSFHIFYQILAAASVVAEANGGCDGRLKSLCGSCLVNLRGLAASDFNYLNCSSCSTLSGHNECDDFIETLEALRDFDIPSEGISDIVGAIIAVLHLGNITFKAPANNSEGSEILNVEQPDSPAAMAGSLLGVDAGALGAILCTKSMTVKDGRADHKITQTRTRAQAADGRDALARHLYGAVFHFVVRKINDVLQDAGSGGASSRFLPFVGVLDIFGFEFFQTNSFEQLCINFTNELLQQYFNEVIFEYEQVLYAREGITWNPQDFPDNKNIVIVLVGDGCNIMSGVLPMLDEECNVPNGAPQSWCRKMVAFYGNKTKIFQPVKTKIGSFVIQHFAGPVEYDSEAFLSKNKDNLSADIVECMKASTSEFVSQRFLEQDRQFGAKTSSKSGSAVATRSKTYTVSSEFRQQLRSLMTNIKSTVPHFVRCIKPNPRNSADEFHRPSVVEQLRYQGVLQAIEVSRAGYPVRLQHREAVLTYRHLAPLNLRRGLEVEAARRSSFSDSAELLFHDLQIRFDLPSEQLQVGASLVFLKRDAADVLDTAIRRLRTTVAVRLQTAWRASSARRKYIAIQAAIIRLQAFSRRLAACRLATELRRYRAAVRLQSAQRSHRARAIAKERLGALTLMQHYMRTNLARVRFLKISRSTLMIQRHSRDTLRAIIRRRHERAALAIQSAWRRILGCRSFARWQAAKQRRDRAAQRLLWRWRCRVLARIWARLRGDQFPPLDAPDNLPGRPGELIAAMRALEYQNTAMAYEINAFRKACNTLDLQQQKYPWTFFRKVATTLWLSTFGRGLVRPAKSQLWIVGILSGACASICSRVQRPSVL